MKNNHAFSNILTIFLVILLLILGGYFGYKNYYKPQTQVSITKTSSTSFQLKKEIGKANPIINKKDNYLEITDSNSNKTINIKIPTTTTIDTSYNYGQSVKSNSKKVTQIEKYIFDDYLQENQIYYFKYTPKLIVPQITGQVGGCLEFEIRISAFNKSYDSILEQYRKDLAKMALDYNDKNIKLNEREFTLENFKAITFDNMPDAGVGHLETLIEIDNNYSLVIATSCQGTKKNGFNDSYLDLYNQVLNSVSENKSSLNTQ